MPSGDLFEPGDNRSATGARVHSKVAKIVVGLAIEKAYFERPESVPKLAWLWEEPMREAIQRCIDDLLKSDVLWEHATAFRLQAAIQEDVPDPDPISWRDLALDIMHEVVLLVDFMYRVGEFGDREIDPTKKEVLYDAYRLFQHWQAALDECVRQMRKENWTEAKVKIEQAVVISTDPDLARFLALDPTREMTIENYRASTRRFHDKVLAFPSRMDIPSQRIDLILATLTDQLRLYELDYRFSLDKEIREACGYAAQTVGRALECLLSADDHVKAARNELDLGIYHLSITMNQVKNEEIRSQLEHVHDDLCILREKLIAS